MLERIREYLAWYADSKETNRRKIGMALREDEGVTEKEGMFVKNEENQKRWDMPDIVQLASHVRSLARRRCLSKSFS